MTAGLEIIVLGLSITSSWGNGHAVTRRALLRALAARGHRITFLERHVPWYKAHRDLLAAGCGMCFQYPHARCRGDLCTLLGVNGAEVAHHIHHAVSNRGERLRLRAPAIRRPSRSHRQADRLERSRELPGCCATMIGLAD